MVAANVLKRLTFFILTILLTTPGKGVAQHMNAKDAPCQTGSNAEQTQCFITEAQAADRELNIVYNKIRRILSPVEQSKLQTVQRLWVQFRDANCAAEQELNEGGSAAPMVHASCLAAETRQRTAELSVMYGWRLQK
jgi:uncharacterized protein YecT (DUF1311 family)